MNEPNCLFCKLLRGEIPRYIIWEDDEYISFLTPFPNTLGFTVVIPKKHQSSYIFEQSDENINKLMKATKTVSKILESRFPDVGRCGLMFEGFEIDHLHAKLMPLHGTSGEWTPRVSNSPEIYFDQYEGYIASHGGKLKSDEYMKQVQAFILGESDQLPE